MALTLKHLKTNVRPLVVEFMGEKVNLTYRPGAITPALNAEIADDGTKQPVILALTRLLSTWDVLDDEGQPLAITENTLMELPSAFLSAAFNAVLADSLVGNGSSATSGAG